MRTIAKQVLWMFVFMAIGTTIDFIVHSSHHALYVEPSYYLGKVIFGVVWGLCSYYILKNVLKVSNWKAMAWGVPALIALMLQTKYFYQSRGNFFVMLFLFLHFLMFLPASFSIFKKKQSIFPVADPRSIKSTNARRWSYFVVILLLLEVAFYIYFNNILGYHRF